VPNAIALSCRLAPALFVGAVYIIVLSSMLLVITLC